MPGKREYRRFVGDHVLTQHDVLEQTRFDDNIGFGGWSIDLHPPGGVYSDAAGSMHLHGPGLYEIPFRSLYSANVSNLLMAGRDISASHVAFGTTRVMATCAVTGEAAGAGAALAARYDVSPRTLLDERRDELQQTLLRQDAAIAGVPWRDARDLALAAEVSASSQRRLLAAPWASRAADVAGVADELVPLAGRDFGLVLPVAPRLDAAVLALRRADCSDSTLAPSMRV